MEGLEKLGSVCNRFVNGGDPVPLYDMGGGQPGGTNTLEGWNARAEAAEARHENKLVSAFSEAGDQAEAQGAEDVAEGRNPVKLSAVVDFAAEQLGGDTEKAAIVGGYLHRRYAEGCNAGKEGGAR